MSATSIELSDFLAQIDLLQLQDRLVAEDIDMSVLPHLDKDDLKELGLNLGQRTRLLNALKALRDVETTGASPSDVPYDTPIQLRRLSVLFCDMVGSTELGEHLGIDDMQIVLQHYYDTAHTVAKRHGGHMAGSQGDGLVMLFGYPRVLEGFADHCVLAAQDLQRTLSGAPVLLQGCDPVRIITRIGIASGQAAVGLKVSDVPGDQMHLVGPVVNRAARLQTVARAQSIAVDVKTRDLTRKTVLYSEAEQHRFKGLPGPAEVFRILGMRHSDDPSSTAVALIGRGAETGVLSALWKHARTGAAATMTISGVAGIGKSALVQSFLASDSTPNARVLRLRCMAMTAQSPLRPVAHALTALTEREHEAPSLGALLNHPTAEMTERAAQVLGVGGSSNRETAISGGDRNAILDLLGDWIIGSADSPTLLVLENAQWVDDSTRDLMVRTAKRAGAENAPLMMLAVTRDEGSEIWTEQSGHMTLSLPRLDEAQSGELLSKILRDTPVPHSVRDNILYHADGNPLMLETLAHAQAEHKLPEVADAVEVPHTIYESVSNRLDGIQSGRSVIEALAVLGTPASLDLLAEVCQQDTQDVGLALDALERAGLVVREINLGRQEVSIRHKVYRDVIYEQIAGKTRQTLHTAAYETLSDKAGIRFEILATHARAAQDWTNTSGHALAAAEALLTRSALIEAGHFFEMADVALKKLPASTSVNQSRLRAVTGLASVERARFGIATDKSALLAQQAVQLARDVGDTKAELLALNGLYSHALVHADYPEAAEYAQALLATAELAQNKTFKMIATRAIGAVALHRGDQSTALPALSQALDQYDKDVHLSLAHAHGYDHAEICAALLSMSLWISGDLQRSRQVSTFSIDHSREIDHAHSLAQAISFRVMLGALARDGSELDEVAAEAIDVAEKLGIRVMRAAARLFPYTTRLCLQTDPPSSGELTDLARRVEEFRAVNPFNYGPLLASVLADVYLRAGDVSAASLVLADATKTEQNTGETWTSSEVLRMRARVAEARGDHPAAKKLRQDALNRAQNTDAATIALRICCDMAEADPCSTTHQAVQNALTQIVTKDQGWDIRRAEALLQDKRDV